MLALDGSRGNLLPRRRLVIESVVSDFFLPEKMGEKVAKWLPLPLVAVNHSTTASCTQLFLLLVEDARVRMRHPFLGVKRSFPRSHFLVCLLSSALWHSRTWEVLKVFSHNRFQQRHLRVSSRSLTFQFAVGEFKVFAQGRVLQAFEGVFRTFPRFQKSAESDRQCGDDPPGGNFHAERPSNGSWRSRRALVLMDAGGL